MAFRSAAGRCRYGNEEADVRRVVAALVVVAAGGCGDAAEPVIDVGDPAGYAPQVDPAGFGGAIDNPYWPLVPGARRVFEGRSEGEAERIEVAVLEETRDVMGIRATVVRDTVFVDGELVEDTFDWYAQDGDGNVWYLGEDSTEYEGGEAVSTAGSWEGGVDGALPGVVMWADPRVGQAYRQEFYEGEAEDVVEVLRTGQSVTVPAGTFDDVLVTREWNPLEPDVVEEKSYAPGVGVILERKVEGGEEVVELIEFTPAP